MNSGQRRICDAIVILRTLIMVVLRKLTIIKEHRPHPPRIIENAYQLHIMVGGAVLTAGGLL